jgi:hypothetical protein
MNRLPFHVWMSLARSLPASVGDEDVQGSLGPVPD